ncbi:MAG: nickel-responsive transcriptional regulator NikR [Phycisphaerales bacterium]|jgi:CopG family nickel-responsive transcriptional regulator
MAQLERIGISLEKDLLSKFDELIDKQGYQSRSEAIRDLVRRQLSAEKLSNPKAMAVAAVFLVYNHHSTKLTDKLVAVQHSHNLGSSLQIISTLHVHLDEHDCMEVIVLRGHVCQINKMAEGILSMKGVKLGRLNIVAT